MKIKYLGTAAAEGIPGLFCNCRICRNALQVKGKEIKTRSQALIDDKILIDFPADTYLHIINYGLDLRNIYNCIVTHSHSDHFYPNDFGCRSDVMAKDIEEKPFHIYVSESGYDKAEKLFGNETIKGKRLNFHKILPFRDFFIEDYRIIPLEADHSKESSPVIYIIEHGEKSILYANDTGYFPNSTIEYLKNYGKVFNMVSLDCTAMALPNWRQGHMGLDTNKEIYDALLEMGCCNSDTLVYVNHFSHNGKLTHKELETEAAKYNFGATYDGLEIEF